MGHDRGGIARLAAVLTEHWAAVEADFRATYRLDLQTCLDRWGCRKVWDHIKHLPPDAALWRAQGRPDVVQMIHQWGTALTELMTAAPKEKVYLPAAPFTPWAEAEEKPQRGMSIGDFVARHQEHLRPSNSEDN